VAQVADRVAIMYAGRIVESAPVGPLFTRPRHPYTLGLLQSVPRLKTDFSIRKPLAAIPGMVPDLTCLPPGCRFQDRCNWVVDKCRREEPLLIQIPDPDDIVRHSACWRADNL